MDFNWRPQQLSYDQYKFLQNPDEAFKNRGNTKIAQEMLGFEGQDIDGKIGKATRAAYNQQMPYYNDLYGSVDKAGALNLSDPQSFYNDIHEADNYGFTPEQAQNELESEQQAEEQLAKQQRIKEIEAEIAEIEQRIAERKRGMAANEDALNTQLAAIEARKINQKDPTSIWRWKAQMDENRRIAEKSNSSNNTAKANAMIEIANDLDSIIVDKKMDSATKQATLSKLANLKTLGEKNDVPKSVIDNINAKISEVKGETQSENTASKKDSKYSGEPSEQYDNEIDELLANPTLEKIAKWKRDNPKWKDFANNDKIRQLDVKHAELIDANAKKTESIKKAKGLVGKKNLTSKEIEFMSGMKGFKKKSDDYGNIWFEEVL